MLRTHRAGLIRLQTPQRVCYNGRRRRRRTAQRQNHSCRLPAAWRNCPHGVYARSPRTPTHGCGASTWTATTAWVTPRWREPSCAIW